MITAVRIGLLAAAALAAPLARSAVPDPDAQLWSEADLIGALAKNTTLTGIVIGRFGQELPNPTLTALGLDLSQRVGHWTFEAGFRHQAVAHSTGGPSISGLAIAVVTYSRTFARSTIAIRSRADNTLHSSGNPWRFRIRGEYRWATPTAGPISYLFINDEEFYQGSASEWSRNRAQAGMNFVLGERSDLLVYYQWQSDRLSTPSHIHALGLTLHVHFK